MLAKTWKVAAVAAAVALSATAVADDYGRNDYKGYKDYKDYNKSVRDYFRCATTPAVDFPGTIVDAALATPALSSLAGAVVAAGLAGTLSGPGPFTVYAPTNDAFAKIPPSVFSALTSDVGLLTAVLTYHVTPYQGRQADPRLVFGTPKEAQTVQGQKVFFSRGEGPQVNQSNVACQPVKTTNGTVWIIDSVLLPQF
jgi:uncharacterized surface protein with fasciclin (FAS1) repeats